MPHLTKRNVPRWVLVNIYYRRKGRRSRSRVKKHSRRGSLHSCECWLPFVHPFRLRWRLYNFHKCLLHGGGVEKSLPVFRGWSTLIMAKSESKNVDSSGTRVDVQYCITVVYEHNARLGCILLSLQKERWRIRKTHHRKMQDGGPWLYSLPLRATCCGCADCCFSAGFPFLPRDAMLARYVLSVIVYLSVRLSVTSRCSTKTAKHIGSRN